MVWSSHVNQMFERVQLKDSFGVNFTSSRWQIEIEKKNLWIFQKCKFFDCKYALTETRMRKKQSQIA